LICKDAGVGRNQEIIESLPIAGVFFRHGALTQSRDNRKQRLRRAGGELRHLQGRNQEIIERSRLSTIFGSVTDFLKTQSRDNRKTSSHPSF